MGVTAKAFGEGSTFPEHSDPNLLRVYSMRFCPYAQRTRLVVKHLKIPHEEVNINLKSKPDWFLARNPLGLVPVLELGDKIIYESAICNEYLNEVNGGARLLPSDPYAKARVKILMELFSKVTDKFYGVILGNKTQEEKEQIIEELWKQLGKYEEAVAGGKYFGGEQPNLLDFHMWPWFERFPAIEKIGNVTALPETKFPRLTAWVKHMRELPAVQEIVQSDDNHQAFVQSYLNGGPIVYDLGL